MTRPDPATPRGKYLKRMAEDGHFSQKLAEAALAVTEAYCKADSQSRAELGSALADEVGTVLRDVYGWSTAAAAAAREDIIQAFLEVER